MHTQNILKLLESRNSPKQGHGEYKDEDGEEKDESDNDETITSLPAPRPPKPSWLSMVTKIQKVESHIKYIGSATAESRVS